MGLRPGSSTVTCSDFFLVGEGFRRAALRVTADLSPEELLSLVRGEHPANGLPLFRGVEGRVKYDLVGTDLGVAWLLSESAVDALHQYQLTGWRAVPASIATTDKGQLDRYSLLVVTGRCGPFDDRYSVEVEVPAEVPGVPPARGLKGLCFDTATWDGSDIFMPHESAAVVVSDTARAAMERAGVSNIALQRLADVVRIWNAHGDVL